MVVVLPPLRAALPPVLLLLLPGLLLLNNSTAHLTPPPLIPLLPNRLLPCLCRARDLVFSVRWLLLLRKCPSSQSRRMRNLLNRELTSCPAVVSQWVHPSVTPSAAGSQAAPARPPNNKQHPPHPLRPWTAASMPPTPLTPPGKTQPAQRMHKTSANAWTTTRVT